MTKTMYRPGQLVEVRSATEILGTLDDSGSTLGVPFMPEMLPHLGQRFRVAQLALKVCAPPGNVNLHPGVVYLEDLRCDGAAHGGCEAECRFFWRQEWLRPVDPDQTSASKLSDPGDDARLAEIATTNASVQGTETPTWRCQATAVCEAGDEVSWKEPRQYVREVTAGNVGLAHFTKVVGGAVWRSVGRRLSIIDRLPVAGKDRVDGQSLDLQSGEWVEVRPLDEIGRTLDASARHRGLTFTDEMAQHCGQRFRVRRRVMRIIDENSGEMLEFRKNACITLEDMVCTGDKATRVWFCRKDNYPYWREAWLQRVAGPAGDTDGCASCPGNGPADVDPAST